MTHINSPEIALIECREVSWVTPYKRTIINSLSLAIGKEKVGLVGRNGVGKSTLLKLLANVIEPSSGEIETRIEMGYVPQYLSPKEENLSVADFLGCSETLALLAKAEQGNLSAEESVALENKWDTEEKLRARLDSIGLKPIGFERQLNTLSGGEQRLLAIAKAAASENTFLLLDEPTNDLDINARQALKQFLINFSGGFLLVSHDRDLLGIVDSVCEMLEQGCRVFGGNYSEFLAAREKFDLATERALETREKELLIAHKKSEESEIRQRKRTQKAKIEAKDKGINRALLGALKERGQETTDRLKKIHLEKIIRQEDDVKKALARIRLENKIEVPLPATTVAADTTLLQMENISFQFPEQEYLIEGIDLKLVGAEHLGIFGANGSGKTTLLKLILRELKPTEGMLNLNIPLTRVAYLDQRCEVLEDSLSLVEMLEKLTGCETEEALQIVDGYKFNRAIADRPLGTLSGGERLRAALTVVLSKKEPPQLLILDEPTNNLDLPSLEKLESALANYKGALIVVTHDLEFAENIELTQRLWL